MWALILCGLEKILRDANIGKDGLLNGMNIVHTCHLSTVVCYICNFPRDKYWKKKKVISCLQITVIFWKIFYSILDDCYLKLPRLICILKYNQKINFDQEIHSGGALEPVMNRILWLKSSNQRQFWKVQGHNRARGDQFCGILINFSTNMNQFWIKV